MEGFVVQVHFCNVANNMNTEWNWTKKEGKFLGKSCKR